MDFYKTGLQILSNVKHLLFKTPIQNYKLNSSTPIHHDEWNVLLQKYVNDKGDVHYLGFQTERKNLQAYLNKLSKNPPNDKNWSKNESLVYWINAYNAFTIELILNHSKTSIIIRRHLTSKNCQIILYTELPLG